MKKAPLLKRAKTLAVLGWVSPSRHNGDN
jgi:hypothetical protein